MRGKIRLFSGTMATHLEIICLVGLPSMRSVGYRQVWEWLRGECSRDEMVARGQAATRQLAKRQFTWLRSERGTHWLDPDGDPVAQALAVVAGPDGADRHDGRAVQVGARVVAQQVAHRAVQSRVRLVGRFGDERLRALLTGIGGESAVNVCERVAERIADLLCRQVNLNIIPQPIQ